MTTTMRRPRTGAGGSIGRSGGDERNWECGLPKSLAQWKLAPQHRRLPCRWEHLLSKSGRAPPFCFTSPRQPDCTIQEIEGLQSSQSGERTARTCSSRSCRGDRTPEVWSMVIPEVNESAVHGIMQASLSFGGRALVDENIERDSQEAQSLCLKYSRSLHYWYIGHYGYWGTGRRG